MQTSLHRDQWLPGTGGKDVLQTSRRNLMEGDGKVLYLDCVGDFMVTVHLSSLLIVQLK